MAALGSFVLCLDIDLTIADSLPADRSVLQALWALSGYFSVLANLLTVIAMAAAALCRWPGGPRTNGPVFTAVTTYMVVLGIVYHFALSGQSSLDTLHWLAEFGLHYLVPSLTLSFWLRHVPKKGLKLKHTLLSLVLPLGYGVMMLTRGALEGWYPYTFVDVTHLGFVHVAANLALLGIAFFVCGLAALAFAWTRLRDPSDPKQIEAADYTEL